MYWCQHHSEHQNWWWHKHVHIHACWCPILTDVSTIEDVRIDVGKLQVVCVHLISTACAQGVDTANQTQVDAYTVKDPGTVQGALLFVMTKCSSIHQTNVWWKKTCWGFNHLNSTGKCNQFDRCKTIGGGTGVPPFQKRIIHRVICQVITQSWKKVNKKDSETKLSRSRTRCPQQAVRPPFPLPSPLLLFATFLE